MWSATRAIPADAGNPIAAVRRTARKNALRIASISVCSSAIIGELSMYTTDEILAVGSMARSFAIE